MATFQHKRNRHQARYVLHKIKFITHKICLYLNPHKMYMRQFSTKQQIKRPRTKYNPPTHRKKVKHENCIYSNNFIQPTQEIQNRMVIDSQPFTIFLSIHSQPSMRRSRFRRRGGCTSMYRTLARIQKPSIFVDSSPVSMAEEDLN
jgi:CHAT domain-containing protein